jgi:hypothetical protein
VREFGTAGVSRMWTQIDSGAASGVELPMYEGGRIQPRRLRGSTDSSTGSAPSG